MHIFGNKIFQAGSALAVIATLLVMMPRAAHSVAAALVEVSNPPASPVNTEDTSRQASQLVSLQCVATDLSYFDCNQETSNGVSGAAYTVPANASLVINAVDFTQQLFPAPALMVTLLTNQRGLRSWAVPPAQTLIQATTTEFAYPAGIVIGPGVAPQIDVNGGSNQIQVVVNLTGYLTSN